MTHARSRSSRHVRPGASALLLALAPVLALAPAPVFAQAAETEVAEVTFARDVVPILQQSCQVCHRPGAIGPMSLLTYADARRWSDRIKTKVAGREMPPYQYDTDIGIQALKYDPRLSEADIAAIVAWADAGAPEGDPADLPPPVDWPDPSQWKLAEQFGPPDLVVPAKPFTVPAVGSDLWWEPLVEIPLETDRYLKAIEVKPSVPGREVVHHANTTLYLQGEDGELVGQGGRFTEYAAGKLGEIIPEGAGRLLPADSLVRWSVHYYPMGEVVENEVTELGFWFHPEDYEPDYVQDLANYRLDGDLAIEPNGNAMIQGFHSFDHPVRIDSFQPHGHLRLRAAALEVYYPETGRREVMSMISNWTTWWQHSHLYEEDVAPIVPAGGVIMLTFWYDNTADNPNNPDPEQWVYRGSRTTDEMSHAWIAVTHLDQEGYEQIVADREEKAAAAGLGGGQ
jgi:mono/diheme cytochrome c family protein